MRKIRLLASLVVVISLFSLVSGAAAQSSYSFSMPREVVNVSWNADGSEAIDYVFTFQNDPNGHMIDFVDVGMPNNNFDTGSITADSGGAQVGISSDFQGQGGSGFSVDMGSQAIPPGGSGTVHVHVPSVTGVLYKDTQNPDTYASADFSPTWFGSQYVHGTTDVSVSFHLPPGVQPQEPKYHNTQGGWPCANQPAAAYDTDNRITYTWECPNANGSTQYTFGASFPKSYVPAGAIVVPPAFDLGKTLSGLGGFLQPTCCIGFFILIFIGIPILNAGSNRKRKLAYLPPKIQIEGHGIKRGLTAVEAAILMQEPLDKVMTMILFGVVKKNAATVVTKEPLKLQITSPQPDDLHDYEKDFLAAFADDNLATRRKGLQDMTVKLVNSISDKMKGFSRKETIAYYQDIMERAWQQIESAGTPEVKSQMLDEGLEWTMLDKNYDDRTRRVFTGPIFLPMWWGGFDPGYHPASTAASMGRAAPSISGGSSGGGRVSLPGSAFAASVVGGVQGFSSRVLGDLNTFTSGITNRTNPAPVAPRSSGGSLGGGGGHCACACACAGCACACAGGGR